MNDKQRILDMVEQGKITAKEAMDLLDALDDTEAARISTELSVKKIPKYKTLKVIVIAEKDNTNVKINVPLGLVRIVGNIAKDYNKFIPEDAKRHMNEQGVDISQIDIAGILQSLEDGTLDDPTIIDIDVNSIEEGVVKVKVFLDV